MRNRRRMIGLMAAAFGAALFLSADPASACHKKRSKRHAATTCAAPAEYVAPSYAGPVHHGPGYTSYPMTADYSGGGSMGSGYGGGYAANPMTTGPGMPMMGGYGAYPGGYGPGMGATPGGMMNMGGFGPYPGGYGPGMGAGMGGFGGYPGAMY